jgi:hypothetical protein
MTNIITVIEGHYQNLESRAFATRRRVSSRVRSQDLTGWKTSFFSPLADFSRRRAQPNSPYLSPVCDEFGANLPSYECKEIDISCTSR